MDPPGTTPFLVRGGQIRWTARTSRMTQPARPTRPGNSSAIVKKDRTAVRKKILKAVAARIRDFSPMFLPSSGRAHLEEERIEKQRLEAYRKSLGLDATPTFGAVFSPLFADPKDPYRIALPPSLMNSAPVSPTPSTPSVHLPSPNSNPFMDSSAKNPSPSSLAPALPRIDPPKSSLPPQPTFSAPRRAF